MMVTKQQQLKWLAKRFDSLPLGSDSIVMSDEVLGYIGYEHKITNQELMQERDKMQKKAQQAAQPAQDNQWHERGELPPVGTICEMLDDRAAWCECKIIANEDGACIGWVTSRNAPFYTYDKSEFRPLRTEREKAIDEMVSVILDYDGYMITSATAELVARQLHYAGYHK